MSLNFPNNPVENQVYTFGSLVYIYQQGRWKSKARTETLGDDLENIRKALNKVQGEEDLVTDVQSGTHYMLGRKTVFGDAESVFCEMDSVTRTFQADTAILEEAITGEMETTIGDTYKDLHKSKTALVIGDEDFSLVFNTSDGVVETSFKIVDTSNQTKARMTRWDGTFPQIFTDVNATEFARANRVYQATPTIARTGNRYWAAWRADVNNAGEGNGNFFVIAYSDDDCVTFVEKYILSYPAADTTHTLIDPMLWVSPEGELWLLWTMCTGDVYPLIGFADGIYGCFAAIMQNPDGAFQTWGKPFRFKEFGDPRKPVRINGEYMIPTDLWSHSSLYPPVNPEKAGCTFCKFDYKNKRIIEVGRNSPNYQTTRYAGFFETELVELTDGRLMSMTRMTDANGGLARSYSDDGGKTWTPQEELNTLLGDISSSRVWLGRLRSGRLLLVYNNSTDRTLLTAVLSEDDGVTFPYSVVLDPPLVTNASYPIVAEGDNGEFFVCYDVGRVSFNQIRITKLVESEIVAGTSVPENWIISEPTM